MRLSSTFDHCFYSSVVIVCIFITPSDSSVDLYYLTCTFSPFHWNRFETELKFFQNILCEISGESWALYFDALACRIMWKMKNITIARSIKNVKPGCSREWNVKDSHRNVWTITYAEDIFTPVHKGQVSLISSCSAAHYWLVKEGESRIIASILPRCQTSVVTSIYFSIPLAFPLSSRTFYTVFSRLEKRESRTKSRVGQLYLPATRALVRMLQRSARCYVIKPSLR